MTVGETSRLGMQIRFYANNALTEDRETIKRVLAFPADTNIVWKSHDESIAQRSAVDEARQQKAGNVNNEKRRQTLIADELDRGK